MVNASPESVPPEDAFSVLGNEIRMAILKVLADSWNESGFDADYGLTFSELRERVGVEDSGKFNYHLQQLEQYFLTKTDEEYKYNYAGWRIIRVLNTELIYDQIETEPITIESTCHNCGNDVLEVQYVNEWAWISCPDCGVHITGVSMPPHAIQRRTSVEIIETCDHRTRRRTDLIIDGICPECFCSTNLTIGEHTWGDETMTRYIYHCPDCDRDWLPELGWYLLDHPGVRSFYEDHDLDLDTVPYWELGHTVSDQYSTVLSRDPWRFQVSVSYDGDEIHFVLDENREVIDSAGQADT